jgi:hypothetical protein
MPSKSDYNTLKLSWGDFWTPKKPPSQGVIRLEDQIGSVQKSIDKKQSQLATCRAAHR